MKKILFILSLFFFVSANAQDGDYDAFLARQFLQNGEMEKAAEYYENLFNQHPQEYYEDYLKVLVQIKQFEKAEKVIKALYKENSDPLYLLDLADLYLQQNREGDAEKQFSKTIKELKPDKYNINQVAQKFIKLKQLDYAQKTYARGKEILKDRNAFNLEIANLYLLKNDFVSMINAYLDEAPYQANDLSVIENGLQKGLTEEKEKDALEKELLKRTQADKAQFVYQDLLVWLYMQRNDFEGAVLQAKSLDMLRNEDGDNVMRISKTAAEQKDFDAAIRGYQYVIDKGPKFSWYVTANLEMINVKRDKLVNSPNYNKEQLLSLKDTYKVFIENYTHDYTATNAIIELAQLEALYIHEIDSAIALLIPITENNRIARDLRHKQKCILEIII